MDPRSENVPCPMAICNSHRTALCQVSNGALLHPNYFLQHFLYLAKGVLDVYP